MLQESESDKDSIVCNVQMISTKADPRREACKAAGLVSSTDRTEVSYTLDPGSIPGLTTKEIFDLLFTKAVKQRRSRVVRA